MERGDDLMVEWMVWSHDPHETMMSASVGVYDQPLPHGGMGEWVSEGMHTNGLALRTKAAHGRRRSTIVKECIRVQVLLLGLRPLPGPGHHALA
jgi:hypothetical protein